MSAVVLGSRMRMMTAANRCNSVELLARGMVNGRGKGGSFLANVERGRTLGLNSAFLAPMAICFKLSGHPILTVDTIFLRRRSGSARLAD